MLITRCDCMLITCSSHAVIACSSHAVIACSSHAHHTLIPPAACFVSSPRAWCRGFASWCSRTTRRPRLRRANWWGGTHGCGSSSCRRHHLSPITSLSKFDPYGSSSCRRQSCPFIDPHYMSSIVSLSKFDPYSRSRPFGSPSSSTSSSTTPTPCQRSTTSAAASK